MTSAVLNQKLTEVEEGLISLNPLRVCTALPAFELLVQFAAAAPECMDQIQRIHRLASQAATIYSGWIAVAASLAGGYDAAGNPSAASHGVLRTEG